MPQDDDYAHLGERMRAATGTANLTAWKSTSPDSRANERFHLYDHRSAVRKETSIATAAGAALSRSAT